MSSQPKTYDQRPPDKDFGPTVLIVDDDELARTQLTTVCEQISPKGSYRTLIASNIPDALQVLANTPIDVVLLDKDVGPNITDPKQNGINHISEILRIQPHVQIVMVTGSKDIQDVVRAITLGAFNYIVKGNPDELLIAQIEKAANVARMTKEKIRTDRSKLRPASDLLAGSSPAMIKLKEQLQVVAESNRPVLLLGASGTGKTTAAKYIHHFRQLYLKQSDRPFIALNMASITQSMAEGELFGNEAGAYTDARSQRAGYIELANHGTLFLDEIGEASLDLQAKLLKVLDDGKFYRLGGKKELTSQFKLVCATNRDLQELVQKNLFRQDLYMRISTFPVVMPGLDERREDIPEIIKSILPKCCEDNQVFISFDDLPKDFVAFLKDQPIEGNVRGIDHILSRLLVFAPKDKRGRPIFDTWQSIVSPAVRIQSAVSSSGVITISDLMNKDYDVVGPGFPGLKKIVKKVIENILKDATQKYERHGEIATALKLSKSNLTLKLEKSGLQLGRKIRAPRSKTNSRPLSPTPRKGADVEVIQ